MLYCSVSECNRKYKCGGYCRLHLRRFKKYGITELPKKEPILCSIYGCGRKHRAKSYCEKHYVVFIRNIKPSIKKCSIELCGRNHKGKGYCNIHYLKFIKYGDPLKIINDCKKTCFVDGCVLKTNGLYNNLRYCSTHLMRLKRNGIINQLPKRKFSRLCSVDKCCKRHEARGLCVKHIARFKTWGDLNKIGSTKGIVFTDEHRKRLSIAKLKYYENGGMVSKLPFKDTKPERKLQSVLSVNNIKYKTDYLEIGRPDIFIEPNTCIFVDGCYFHANPKKYKSEDIIRKERIGRNGRITKKLTAQMIWDKDESVNKKLKNKGYKIIRFWEHEINDDPMKCLYKINLFIYAKPKPRTL